MSLLTYPKFQSPDISGVNLSGGLVYFYEVGTSTPKDTYTDDTFATPNANPVVLDSRGEADIYLDGKYKIILKDADDVEIWTKDNHPLNSFSLTIPFGETLVFENDGAAADPPTMSNADGEILCTREIRMHGNQALFGVNNDSASDIAFATDTPTDSQNRFTIDGNGQHRWGDGTAVQDTSAYRHSAASFQFEGEGNSLFRVRDNTNAAGYAGISFQSTGSQRYCCGIGAPSEATFSVADKYFIYDPIAGKMRLTIDTNGATRVCGGVVAPAAGSSAAVLLFGTTTGFGIYYGSGAPTASAAKGSLYLRTDGTGTSDRMYVNTDGSTTWTAVTTAA